MSFKNALKNLVTHFGVVWALLLFILFFAAAITGLSLPFLLPISRAFAAAGVFDSIRGAFTSLFAEGNFQSLWEGLRAAYESVVSVFVNDSRVLSLSIWFVTLILVFVFRFFLGLYEIPMTTVMDGQMSCNCKYGFGGKFVSTLLISVRYSFAKMLFTVLFDAAIYGVMYGLRLLIGMNIGFIFLALIILLALFSLRFSIVACWAPCVVAGECGIVKGFFHSAKICFKRFGSIFSTYVVSFMLMGAIGIFLAIFTLGVGLVLIMPFFACYVSYLNITEYYNKTGKRYYIDDAVFTPSTENAL